MNDFGYVMGAWLPLIIWQQADAPRYHKAFIAGACGSVVAIFLTIGIKFLAQRDIARLMTPPSALSHDTIEQTS